MRFDDLLVPEEDYVSGPCESRREWLFMYSCGVPADVIASWCRVASARVRRTIDKQVRDSPSWFDQCLRIHNQPVDLREKFNRPTREELWWKHYNDVAAHVTAYGILPSQNHGDHARVLYRWIEAQRRQNDAGNLTEDKLDALDRLGSWQGVRRGRPDEHWTRRLTELCLFHQVHGRLPMYDPVRRPGERLLAVWLVRQRTWERKGRLRLDRRQSLTAALPGWMPEPVEMGTPDQAGQRVASGGSVLGQL